MHFSWVRILSVAMLPDLRNLLIGLYTVMTCTLCFDRVFVVSTVPVSRNWMSEFGLFAYTSVRVLQHYKEHLSGATGPYQSGVICGLFRTYQGREMG